MLQIIRHQVWTSVILIILHLPTYICSNIPLVGQNVDDIGPLREILVKFHANIRPPCEK